jgi:hypothetical protein
MTKQKEMYRTCPPSTLDSYQRYEGTGRFTAQYSANQYSANQTSSITIPYPSVTILPVIVRSLSVIVLLTLSVILPLIIIL